MLEVTFLPIFFAGVVSVVIGFIWYHPKVFGSFWIRLTNLSPEAVEKGKKRMPVMAFIGLLASMLVAYVMSFMLPVLVVPDWIGAIELAFWCWVGFVAPTMLGMVLWEQKSFKLYLINALYWLVSFVAIAEILVF
ncbi:DUF1761 domain-containing protein [Candidatus Kaiserbacteria bacterium]|nr:DUF1761 domain-containing protein [Candidatus Kaiserbacteria bacterium]